ncbi:MAG: hypothetical protein V7785_08105 [Bermanella sp.]
MIRIFILCISFLILPFANAGDAQGGLLSNVHVMKNGALLVSSSGARTDVPGCVNYSTRFVIDGTTEAGRVQISGLLAMYMGGKTVNIIGTGACDAGYSSEEINYFHAVD